MIVTTTNCIEGHNVKEYKGIVHGEVILGTNIVRDFFASINDLVGGRSANAILGIDLDYETVGQNSMMMVSASGTAVVID